MDLKNKPRIIFNQFGIKYFQATLNGKLPNELNECMWSLFKIRKDPSTYYPVKVFELSAS